MKYTLPRIKLHPAPVHIVQYYGSPHASAEHPSAYISNFLQD